MTRPVYTALFLLIPIATGTSQESLLWVYFADKGTQWWRSTPALSERALTRRAMTGIPLDERDYPVNVEYLRIAQRECGGKVKGTSRWLNAAVFEGADSACLARLPFVCEVRMGRGHSCPLGHIRAPAQKTASPTLYGYATSQITMLALDSLHQMGFRGRGVVVALLDAGFPGIDTMRAFERLRQEGRLLATFDVPEGDTAVTDDHPHGTWVLSVMAAWLPGELVGAAPEAYYILIRTEVADSERLAEEFFWVRGAEIADSMGAQVINSSLGYSTFDNPNENHSYSDLDGNTTPVTVAADIAAQKGIIVVNSAGNSRATPWHYIIAPADGDSVLAVGAVNPDGTPTSFSSVGPTADRRIKPDVVAQGAQVAVAHYDNRIWLGAGTSFSSPLIASLAVCLLSAFPDAGYRVTQVIRSSGNRSLHPDTLYGYGIPSAVRAYRYLSGEEAPPEWSIQVFHNAIDRAWLVVRARPSAVMWIIGMDGKVVKQVNVEHLRPHASYYLKIQMQSLPAGFYLYKDRETGQVFPVLLSRPASAR